MKHHDAAREVLEDIHKLALRAKEAKNTLPRAEGHRLLILTGVMQYLLELPDKEMDEEAEKYFQVALEFLSRMWKQLDELNA